MESRPAGSIPRLTASPDVGSAHWWWLAAVGLRLVLRSLGFMGFWPLLLVTHVIVVPLAAVGLTLLKPVRWTHAGLYTLALGLADPWLLMMAAVDTGEMLVGPSVLITLVVSVSVALFARSRERARAGAGPR